MVLASHLGRPDGSVVEKWDGGLFSIDVEEFFWNYIDCQPKMAEKQHESVDHGGSSL